MKSRKNKDYDVLYDQLLRLLVRYEVVDHNIVDQDQKIDDPSEYRDIKDVEACLERMENRGFVTLTKTKDGFAAVVTGEGRLFEKAGGFLAEFENKNKEGIRQLKRENLEYEKMLLDIQDLYEQKKSRNVTRIIAIIAIILSGLTIIWSVVEAIFFN